MSQSRRAQNLHLARHLCDGLGNLVAELAPSTNEAELIRMGQGKKDITNAVSQTIEQRLNLPPEWMDRDNEGLLKMSPLDYAIHKKISLLPGEAKEALLAFVAALPAQHRP